MEETRESNTNLVMDDQERVSEHTFGDTPRKKARTTNMDDGQETNGVGSDVEAYQVLYDEFIPDCDNTIKPYLGQRFETIDKGVQFYKRYAAEVGFDVRCSTMKKNRKGDVEVKYLLCSREGHAMNRNEGTKPTSEDTTRNIKTRRRVSNRVGCKARCALRRQKDGCYAVKVFQELHNHPLCSKLARPFLKINRKLDGNALEAKLWNEFYTFMELSKGNITAMQEMLNFLQDYKGKMLKSRGKTQHKSNNTKLLETFYDTQTTTSITVKPPQISRTKGVESN
nr:protein FAR1-RELATED SEQUENCE 5-like [Ipomoea batatas]